MAWEPDYATPEELAAYLRIEDMDAESDDVELANAVSSASRSVDDYCRRQFGNTDAPETRSFFARQAIAGYMIGIDDVHDGVGLLVDGEPLTASHTLMPLNASVRDRPYTRLFVAGYVTLPTDPISVTTASWGWSEVPAPVHNATLIQAGRFFKRRDAPFGIAGSPEAGSEVRLLARLDPDVAVMLHRYRRIARAR